MASPFIVKANGNQQRFSPRKLTSSLIKCGVHFKQAKDYTNQISERVTDKMSSRQVFQLAHHQLLQLDRPIAYRYSLKRGIFELGPTGFPFEQIIGRLHAMQGYQVQTNQMIAGKCITHEVDALLEKSAETTWVECKFHNEQGAISDLKTALYVFGRYIDLKDNFNGRGETAMSLVSNTRFSKDAIQFCECRGIKLLGWDYPENAGLNVLLERYKLYPITIINSLKRRQKNDLIQSGIITTQDFQRNRKKVQRVGISERGWREINADLDQLHSTSVSDHHSSSNS